MRGRVASMCFVIALAATPAAAQSLVYRVDQATAVIDGKQLVVTAKGAVRTGGWEKPRLIVRKRNSESGDIEVEFQATPPPDKAVVAHTVVPVDVSLKMRMPKKSVAAVRVVSETNAVTAQIIAKTETRKTAGK